MVEIVSLEIEATLNFGVSEIKAMIFHNELGHIEVGIPFPENKNLSENLSEVIKNIEEIALKHELAVENVKIVLWPGRKGIPYLDIYVIEKDDSIIHIGFDDSSDPEVLFTYSLANKRFNAEKTTEFIKRMQTFLKSEANSIDFTKDIDNLINATGLNQLIDSLSFAAKVF